MQVLIVNMGLCGLDAAIVAMVILVSSLPPKYSRNSKYVRPSASERTLYCSFRKHKEDNQLRYEINMFSYVDFQLGVCVDAKFDA